MSERKVLNKYYPPDFDPNKIPKLKGPRNKTFNIRVMAPFNMRCNTCGEYIYKGKKFNSRKDSVENENYLGLHIHRFYIKCPRCVSEIAFKTDPENTDYTLEAGATRNFEAAKTAMAQAVKAEKEKEEEELNNPMKVLENRTKASRNEMERIENLEELRELNSRHAKVDHESMMKMHALYEEQLQRLQDEEDETLIREAFGRERIKRLADSDSDEEGPSRAKQPASDRPTDILLQPTEESAAPDSSKSMLTSSKPVITSSKPSTSSKSRDSLKNLVKPKQSALKGLVIKKNSDGESKKLIDTQEINDKTALGADTSKTSDDKAKVGALSLLGNYSESDESE